jgi:hypothetical protein
VTEVEADKQPAEGEVLVLTLAGGFLVKGSVHDIAQKLAAEEWPTFELAETEDKVIIRSSQVVALRGGSKTARRGHIGFAPH